MKIKEIVLNDENITNDLIILSMIEICNNGDTMIIKSDGLRNDLKYSIIISSSNHEFNPIRRDAETIYEGVKKALNEYVKNR